MKKLILTLLLGGLIMTGLSAKTAFVYFSATRNGAANALSPSAQAVEADLDEAAATLQNLQKTQTLRAEKILPAEAERPSKNMLKVCSSKVQKNG